MPYTPDGHTRTCRARGPRISAADRLRVARRARMVSLVVVASWVLAGCGNAFFWQQSGRAQAQFEVDSAGCAGDALRARRDADKEKVYRACMRGNGWQRVQAHTPAP